MEKVNFIGICFSIFAKMQKAGIIYINQIEAKKLVVTWNDSVQVFPYNFFKLNATEAPKRDTI